MLFSEYLKTLDRDAREALAAQVSPKKSVGYLYQVAGGHRLPSAAFSKRLEEATGGQVTRAELRPDLFGDMTTTVPAAGLVA